jgi:alkanesulfonate monooxygenase SsuD/methylene tetrahydromethanopterin reductase-like flavin-dependent oxidoreductase (luciferase family)
LALTADIAKVCDEAGMDDYMIGEHASQAWEAIPNPELVIAAAAMQTKRIRFAPMAHLLPYHMPGSLAIQVGWLSQILEGRYFLGVAPGAFVGDAQIRGQPADLSQSRERFMESLEIMTRIWERKPFDFQGKYFSGGYPEELPSAEGTEENLLPDFSPWGGADAMEIAVTGISINSPTIGAAGARNWSPITDFGGLKIMASHWAKYSEASLKAGHTPDPQRWRVCRDVFVADTDAEAKRRAINGAFGKSWEKYVTPIFKRFNLFEGFIEDAGLDVDKTVIDLDFLAEHVWICGSPETVSEKIQEMAHRAGSFGEIGMKSHDWIDDPAPWFESIRRFVEVANAIEMPAAPAQVAPSV